MQKQTATNKSILLKQGMTAQDFNNAEALVEILKFRLNVMDAGSGEGAVEWPEATTTSNEAVKCSGGTVFATQDGMIFCVQNTFNNNKDGCDSYNMKPCGAGNNLAIDVNREKWPITETPTLLFLRCSKISKATAQDFSDDEALVEILKFRLNVMDAGEKIEWPVATTSNEAVTCNGTVFATQDGMIYCVQNTFKNSPGCDSYNMAPCGEGGNSAIDVTFI